MCISNLRGELATLKNSCVDQVEKLEQVKSAHHAHLEELDQSRRQLTQAIRDCDEARSTIDDLKLQVAQMDGLRKQADRASSLALECEANNGIVADLRQRLESLKSVHQQLHDHQIDAENKTIKISELSTRLQIAEAAAQQVFALEKKVHEYEEQIQPLRGAQERVDWLESELRQRNKQVDQLNIKVADCTETLGKMDNLEKQLANREDQCDSMKKSLEAAGQEAARALILENETQAQKDDIQELKAKLAEAQKICTTVPEMQAQMAQFSETFSNLKRELEEAHQNAEELQSTEATNVSLRQTIMELQAQAAVAEQANDSVNCLNVELQQKDAQITALRVELNRYHAESQLQKVSRQVDMEDILGKDFFLETSRLAENDPLKQDKAATDSALTDMARKTGHTIQGKSPPRKIRKSANRSASNLEAKTVGPDSMKYPPELTHARPDAIHKTSTNHAGESRTSAEQTVDEITVVPESQPQAQRPNRYSPARNTQGRLKGSIMSSSPLSDIGELFDPSDQDLPASSRDGTTQVHRNKVDNAALENRVAAIEQTLGEEDSLLNEGHRDTGSQRQACNFEKPSQGSRPPSSSYGEPLLLDDLEGVGSSQTSGSKNIALAKQSNPSTQDILTSPLPTVPRKLPKMNVQVRPKVTSPSRSGMNLADANERSKYLPSNQSPQRVGSSESSFQTNTRRPPQDLGDDVNSMRPATPTLPVKEKHQPNSAVKRKSDTVGMSDETAPSEEKRARRNLSNMEISSRRRAASQSLGSSTSDKAGHSMTRLRQSSTSTGASRSTIVGKNSPAPGNRKQGPKKPRGGSKSEDCLITTISRGY